MALRSLVSPRFRQGTTGRWCSGRTPVMTQWGGDVTGEQPGSSTRQAFPRSTGVSGEWRCCPSVTSDHTRRCHQVSAAFRCRLSSDSAVNRASPDSAVSGASPDSAVSGASSGTSSAQRQRQQRQQRLLFGVLLVIHWRQHVKESDGSKARILIKFPTRCRPVSLSTSLT